MITSENNYNVLITDDDRAAREALREIMVEQGFHTHTASCGEEAIEIVQDEKIHLVLLDMHMPTLTGLETLAIARQSNEVLPGILITADASEEVIRQAFNARVFSVIPKPVRKNVVIYTVVRALGRVYGAEEESSESTY